MLDSQNMSNTFEKPVLWLSRTRENIPESGRQPKTDLLEFEMTEFEKSDLELTEFEREELARSQWPESELLEIEQAESQWEEFEHANFKQTNWSESELLEIEQAESQWEEFEQTEDDALEITRQQTIQVDFFGRDEVFFNDRLTASDCRSSRNDHAGSTGPFHSLESEGFDPDNFRLLSERNESDDSEIPAFQNCAVINNRPKIINLSEAANQEENFPESLSSAFGAKSKNQSKKCVVRLVNKLQMIFLLAFVTELFLYAPMLWSESADFSIRFHAWISILAVGFGLTLGRFLPITSAVSFIILLSYKEICVSTGLSGSDYLFPTVVLIFLVYAQYFLFNLMRGILFFRQTY